MTRLFVAVWPPRPVIDLVERLPRAEHPGVRWTTRDQWHITLRFLGEAAEGAVGDALAAAAPFPAAEAVAGPRVGRLGRGVLMVPVRGLEEVAAAVDRAVGHLGRARDHDRFRGHLTLARLTGTPTSGLTGAAFAARWPVGEVALVASALHPKGARYTTVATFPTADAT